MPKYHVFSVFYERMRDEAIAIFYVMYYAQDFETFYKTASWAKMSLNEGQFLYSYYIAVRQRNDTLGIVLPDPYELYPQYFFNMDVFYKMNAKYFHKIENFDTEYGIVKEQNNYVFYVNYSSSLTYPNTEQKLAYFTEDIGLNAYYYYFHTRLPFWFNSEKNKESKESCSEIDFYFKLLARYDLERYSNALSELLEFSWILPFKTGYYPQLSAGVLPFAQRSNYYDIYSEKNFEAIRYLDAYEKTFSQYLPQCHLKASDKVVNFTNPNAINFAGNSGQTHADLCCDEIIDYQHSYEITARHVLSGSPIPYDKYTFMPSALDFFQTSLRDPAFYQLYQRIVNYFIHYKQHLQPYSYDDLHFVGVKINDVQVSKLVTYFNYFDFNYTNSITSNAEQLKKPKHSYVVRQPRLNHESFSVNIDVSSDIASDAVFKLYIAPKYNSHGYPVNIEEERMKFYELDMSVQTLRVGDNKVERNSSQFVFFKDDSLPTNEIYKYLEEGKVPYDMSVVPNNMPRRLMLPKGTHGGSPFQFFLFVYPFNGVSKDKEIFMKYDMDYKTCGYPFDRPVNAASFKQPNMFVKDIEIYHKGEVFPYQLNIPSYFTHNKN